MNNRLALFSIRWLERKTPRAFIKTLSHTGWSKAPVDLIVLVHGKGRLTLEELTANVLQTIDVHKWTKGRMPAASLYAMRWAMERGYAAVGVLDDDAYFPKPQHAVGRFLDGIEQGYAAVGPISSYRVFATYHEKPGRSFYQLPHLWWTTAGCQIYSMKFVQQVYSMVEPLLSKLECWGDLPMFMLAHLYGHKTAEVYTPFAHTTRRYTVSGGQWDRAWLLDRKRRIMRTCQLMRSFFKGTGDEYLDVVNRAQRNGLANGMKLHMKWKEAR